MKMVSDPETDLQIQAGVIYVKLETWKSSIMKR